MDSSAGKKKEKVQAPLDYVIMSIPVREHEEKNGVWEQHVSLITKEKVGRSAQFEIPSLHVGTFDTLMALSDELGRIDTFAEGVCRKIINTLAEVLANASACLHHHQHTTTSTHKRARTRNATQHNSLWRGEQGAACVDGGEHVA